MKTESRSPVLRLLAGELVEVRSRDEILATLDANGRLENLPFMPEMLRYCGRRMRVYKRAHKTCDNIKAWSMRRVKDAVHLEDIRCDGADHGGCQAGCMIFWKEAWLKRVSDADGSSGAVARLNRQASGRADTLVQITTTASTWTNGEPVYSCQATELRAFTSDLPWWNLRQYIDDVRSGNLAAGVGADYRSHHLLETALGVVLLLRSMLIMAFNRMQRRRHSSRYPFIDGALDKTPRCELNLQPGELVQVRSREEIVATLDTTNRNRGLQFEGEMLRYCGNIYRVLRRVDRIIDEKTGRMLNMKSPCIILSGVICQGDNHVYCPRAIYSYWRENWLVRVNHAVVSQPAAQETE